MDEQQEQQERQGQSNETEAVQRPKRRRRKKKRGIRWDRIAVAFVIVIVIISALVYGIGAVMRYVSSPATNSTSASPIRPEAVATIPVEQKALDKPIYILVVGRDASQQGEGDAIFLAALNKDQGKLDIIGIPSNTKIESRDKTSQQAIDTFYSAGNIKLTKAVVEDMFHISVPYYVIVDEEAFKKMVNIWGTPDLYVKRDMVHFESGADTADINLARGYQRLTDDKALQYMRFLDEDGNAFSRTVRTERLIKEIISRQTESLTVTKLWNVWRIWGDFTTNISSWDAVKLTFAMRSMEAKQIRYFILPGTKETIDGTTYWAYDPTEAQQLIGITMGNEPVDIGSEPTTGSGTSKSNSDANGKINEAGTKNSSETEADKDKGI